MPAPANDNWASAVALTLGTPVTGTTVLATAEAGEPANNGNTVWYKLSPAASVNYLFSTAKDANTTRRTKLQIFAGTGEMRNSSPTTDTVATMVELGTAPQAGTVGGQPWSILAVYNANTLFKTSCGNWDLGSCVVATLPALTPSGGAATYYIRVDSVGGAAGPFGLTATFYKPTRIGACNDCPPNSRVGVICLGSTTSLSGPTTSTDFGLSWANPLGGHDWPAGKYTVQYCGGATSIGVGAASWTVDAFAAGGSAALKTGANTGPNWTVNYIGVPISSFSRARTSNVATIVTQGSHGMTTGDIVTTTLFGDGSFDATNVAVTVINATTLTYGNSGANVGTTSDVTGVITPNGVAQFGGPANGPIFNPDQQTAEASFQCMFLHFNHNGGAISIQWHDDPFADNTNGAPNPIWGLYQVVPVFQAISACAAWTTEGSAANCTFKLRNLNDVSWSALTATLTATGGISSPSAPQGGLSVTANGELDVTFSFNCSTTAVTGTIELTSAYFTGTISIPFNLMPIWQNRGASAPVLDASRALASAICVSPAVTPTCSGSNLFNVDLTIANLGYWGFIGAAVVITPSNGVVIGNINTAACFAGVHGTAVYTDCPGSSSMTIAWDANCNAAKTWTLAIAGPPPGGAAVDTVITLAVKSAAGNTVYSTTFGLTVPP